ncbi:MAG: hypothetical protein FWG75_10555 [Cystobacterineae bacterium]|nr:hypothetical protein [Cystobacterineae bacterium]
MKGTRPVVLLATVACGVLATLPLKAFSSESGAICINSENKPTPFEALGFSEIRNAHIVSANTMGFFEQNLSTLPLANRLYEDSLARAQVVSSAIPSSLADEYTISRVVFEKEVSNTNCNCVDCELVEFQIALDCNTCVKNAQEMNCFHNNEPHWINVDFNPSINPTLVSGKLKRVEIDTLSTGFVGSQLCWRGIFRSQKRKSENQNCMPTLQNLNIGYQSIKSGEYTHSSPMPVANMAFISSYITPKSQFDTETSSRIVTGDKDNTRRGMVRAYELYNPEKPEQTTKKLKWSLKSGISNPSLLDYGSAKAQGMWTPTATGDFNDFLNSSHLSSCHLPEGMLMYDLDRNSVCNNTDLSVLKDWLTGFDTHTNMTRVPRAHGAIPTAFHFSTPAIFTSSPLSPPPWVRLSSLAEIHAYNQWKATRPNPEMALLFLGSTTGEIYAVDAGAYIAKEQDDCLDSTQHHRGHFKPLPGCPKEDGAIKRQTGELSGNPGAGKVKTVYYPWALRPNYIYEYNTKYYGTEYQSAFSALRPSLNASASFVDVDFMSTTHNAPPPFEDPLQPLPWKNATPGPTPQGAHSLLALSSGPKQSLFQVLRIGEDERLYSLWEVDFKTNVRVEKLWNEMSSFNKPRFARNSSRHTPLLGRFMFNRATNPLPTGVAKWLAVVDTDYSPGVDFQGKPLAGAVYFVDLYTGDLLKLSPQMPGADGAAFISLEPGEGVGGEMVALDLQYQTAERPKSDPDGIYDVIYIPTTMGRIYRINLLKYNSGGSGAFLGNAYLKCKVVDIQEILKTSFGVSEENARRQGIYSNMAIYQKGKKVHIYVGTADNPDIYDNKISPPAERYYVFAFELDESSVGTAACAPAKQLWAKALPAGEKVWGGVSANAKEVVVGTATGGSSDICGLDSKTEGHLYLLDAETGDVLKSKEGQVVASPVAFDGHILYVDAKNNFEIMASEGVSGWNNSPGPAPVRSPPVMQILEQSFEKDVRKKDIRQKTVNY